MTKFTLSNLIDVFKTDWKIKEREKGLRKLVIRKRINKFYKRILLKTQDDVSLFVEFKMGQSFMQIKMASAHLGTSIAEMASVVRNYSNAVNKSNRTPRLIICWKRLIRRNNHLLSYKFKEISHIENHIPISNVVI